MHLWLLVGLSALVTLAAAGECPCKVELGHPTDDALAEKIEVRRWSVFDHQPN